MTGPIEITPLKPDDLQYMVGVSVEARICGYPMIICVSFADGLSWCCYQEWYDAMEVNLREQIKAEKHTDGARTLHRLAGWVAECGGRRLDLDAPFWAVMSLFSPPLVRAGDVFDTLNYVVGLSMVDIENYEPYGIWIESVDAPRCRHAIPMARLEPRFRP